MDLSLGKWGLASAFGRLHQPGVVDTLPRIFNSFNPIKTFLESA